MFPETLYKAIDIIGWLITERKEIVQSCLRGSDNRRLDYDLDRKMRLFNKILSPIILLFQSVWD